MEVVLLLANKRTSTSCCFSMKAVLPLTKTFVTVTNPLNGPHGPLARFVILRVVHAPRIPGRFPHHCGLAIPTCITARAMMHAGIVNWRYPLMSVAGKTFPALRRMRNPQFYVPGKRFMMQDTTTCVIDRTRYSYSVMVAMSFISIYIALFTPTHKPYEYDPHYKSLWIHCLVGNELDQTNIIEIKRGVCHLPRLDMHLLYMHIVHSWHFSVRIESWIYRCSFYTKGTDVQPYHEICNFI